MNHDNKAPTTLPTEVAGALPDKPALPTYSEDGVDLTLIRWMLSLTPAERLRVAQSNAEAAFRLHGKARRV